MIFASHGLIYLSYQVGISLVAINRDLKSHPLSITEEAAYKELDRCADFFYP
ncbi:MAG: hypothetical protein WCG14_06595 [Chlamydiia bacterium]